MSDSETALSGGHVTPVVRAGATIRRVPGAWTPAVHALLLHLEQRGFAGAPRALGYDGQGREILSYIAGSAGHEPMPPAFWSDSTLRAVATLIRAYHDATEGFIAPSGAAWQLAYPDSHRHEVICHNDLAPYNTLYADAMPIAFIDFDMAGPGPRAWDLAYAAYRFVPLERVDGADVTRSGLCSRRAESHRIRLFCDTYGITAREVLALVVPRLEQMCATIRDSAAAGSIAFQRMLEEGHLEHYRHEIARLRESLPLLMGDL